MWKQTCSLQHSRALLRYGSDSTDATSAILKPLLLSPASFGLHIDTVTIHDDKALLKPLVFATLISCV